MLHVLGGLTGSDALREGIFELFGYGACGLNTGASFGFHATFYTLERDAGILTEKRLAQVRS